MESFWYEVNHIKESFRGSKIAYRIKEKNKVLQLHD
jgi:hypothetical protein